MKNKILIIGLAIGFASLSSCGIFRKKEKVKYVNQIDSVATKVTAEKNIDTGSVLAYRKTTIYNPLVAPDLTYNAFTYPKILIDATQNLVTKTAKLSDGDKTKTSRGVAATVEEWTLEKKGASQIKDETEKIDLNKDLSGTQVKTEGNPKTFTILVVVGAFLFLLVCIFAFLYWKSKVPKLPKL